MRTKCLSLSSMIVEKVSERLKVRTSYFLLILLLGYVHSIQAQTRQQLTPLKSGDKVLWIGNSYSGFYGPTYDALNALLKASSPAIDNVTFANKGKGMGIILEYATWYSLGVINEIQKGGLSYVVIQSWEDAFYRWGSGTLENGTPNPDVHSGRDEAARIKARDVMLANIKILDAEIKKVGAKTILFEPHVSTWDYRSVYPSSQKTFSEILPSLNCVYAPVLWSWEKVRIDHPTTRYECANSNSDGFIKMLYSDCGHQNYNGTALDAYTFYTMFTGKSAVGLNPSHSVFSSMNADKAYLAGVGHTVGLQIIALNNNGDSEAPTAPANLQTSNITASAFTLTWTASTDNIGVASYEVFEGSLSKGTTTSTSLNINGLKASTTYNITVKAKDATGNVSASSSVKSVTTLPSSDIQAPTPPTMLTSSAITSSSFTLSWSASTDNTGVEAYDIFRDGVSIGSSTTTSFNVIGLSPSTNYGITIKARDEAGNTSTASAVISVTTLAPDLQAPTIPTSLSVTGLASTTFTLNWAASSDNVAVVRYEVYMDGQLYGNTTGAETNMPVPFLNPSTSYKMSVRAKDAAGNTSLLSDEITVTTIGMDEVTSKGQNLPNEGLDKLTDGDLNSKWLDFNNTSWVQFSNASGQRWNTYEITSGNDAPERDPRDWTILGSNDGVNWTTLDTRRGQTWTTRNLTATFSFANSNSYNFYKWDITDNGGAELIQSSEFKFSYNIVLSSLTSTGANNYLIYPNPVREKLTLTLQTTVEDGEAQMLDLNGRVVAKAALRNTSVALFNVEGLEAGVYSLSFKSATQVINEKVVVIK